MWWIGEGEGAGGYTEKMTKLASAIEDAYRLHQSASHICKKPWTMCAKRVLGKISNAMAYLTRCSKGPDPNFEFAKQDIEKFDCTLQNATKTRSTTKKSAFANH